MVRWQEVWALMPPNEKAHAIGLVLAFIAVGFIVLLQGWPF